ncbi:MAG: DNA mismatch repair protein MutS [Oscillospiraceae bacterium]|nr:DNA mismatch repair protein MutS [Oscillospiraceae bacterium]
MPSAMTPMMRQYNALKAQAPDSLLFFRLGDFYEMFGDDARLVSRELNLTLTTRDRHVENPEDRTEMCGVPYHSYEAYAARLLKKGYKIAICEQVEDPATAKGLVDRAITRVITPGTVLEPSMLTDNASNYIAAVYVTGGEHAQTEVLQQPGAAICVCELSTGACWAAAFTDKNAEEHIVNELVRYAPAEVLFNAEAMKTFEVKRFLEKNPDSTYATKDEYFELEPCRQRFNSQFENPPRSAAFNASVLCASGALLAYLAETQKGDLSYIHTINYYTAGQYMELDQQTRRNLELTETLRNRERKGSLLSIIDKTKTSMGARLLRAWLEKPLLSLNLINRRLCAVDELTRSTAVRGEIGVTLKAIEDMERLAGRVAFGTANARDLAALSRSSASLPLLKELLINANCQLLQEIARLNDLQELRTLIENAIGDEPPFSIREGGFIRPGFNPEVDRLRGLSENSKTALADIETRERKRTGLSKLKIGYNRVFGYYLEISRGQSGTVPDDYTRKQTLSNAERFITPELKELESDILSAKDKLTALEYDIFANELMPRLKQMADDIRGAALDVATLDCLCSLAEAAVRNNYCMPDFSTDGAITIKNGRHPVVEQTLSESMFVPNDTILDSDISGGGTRIAIITGPNMAGKSTYMRQTALICLLAQIGSFVPAASAVLPVIDRVFTRIGASDDLSSGQSTFMVEMNEVAQILRSATPRSLLILDEIGRGTSTYDGMAIARAVLEYCADGKTLGAKTMFATHYHELAALEKEIPGVKNYSISVKKRGDDIVFLRKIIAAPADRSYGVEVAKLAGLPEKLIRRARSLLKLLETDGGDATTAKDTGRAEDNDTPEQIPLYNEALERLRSLDIDTLSPIEAMNVLYELKQAM